MAAQVAAEAAEEEEHKGSNISSQKSNMYNPRPKRDRQEAVSAARGATTSTSALNSPQTKRHSCLSKPRMGGYNVNGGDDDDYDVNVEYQDVVCGINMDEPPRDVEGVGCMVILGQNQRVQACPV